METIVTPEDLAAEELALEAAFTGIDPVPTPEPEPKPEESAPVVPEPVTPEPVKGMTIDDFNAAMNTQKQEMQKNLDRVFGKVGNLEERLNAIKSTAGGFSAKQRAKIETEFPEMAALLFEEEPEPAPIPEVKPEPAPVIIQRPERDIEEEKELLSFDHPDWETVVASPDFASWKATLPAKVVKRLEETEDAGFVSGKLTVYKSWLSTKTQAATEKAEKDKLNKERLEAAINPKGVPRAAATGQGTDEEEAAMLEAYNTKSRR